MITSSAIAGMASLLLVSSGLDIPNLDVRRTCRDIAGSDGLRTCLNEERYARRKLVKYWTKIPLSYKRQCLLDPLPPDPSYIYLRDCINNNVIIHQRRSQD